MSRLNSRVPSLNLVRMALTTIALSPLGGRTARTLTICSYPLTGECMRLFATRTVLSFIALLLTTLPAFADYYWDANGTTAGAGSAPSGTWGSDSFWNTDSTGGAGG